MAYYRISEISKLLKESLSDGLEYAEISIIEADDDLPESIMFRFVDDDHFEEEVIDSVPLPDDL